MKKDFVMKKDRKMELYDFIEKETPSYEGFMVCRAKYRWNDFDFESGKEVEVIKEEYMLVERRKISSGDHFTINKRLFYDYDFAWNEDMPWEVIYKKEK